jgi:hypothetical protein
MKARYKYTNLIARDWQRLAQFYEDVFGCVRVPPERHLSGPLTFTCATDPEGNILEL